jgi:hypothetical protein
MFRNLCTDRPQLIAVLLLAVAVALFATGCGVHVNDSEKSSGEKKNVDIETPIGSLHVRKDAEAGDVGLDVYPGAQNAQDPHHGNANISLGNGDFGVKIIASHYQTSDPADKVVSFYEKQLGKYGSVVNCPNGIVEKHDSNTPKDEEIRCKDHRSADRVPGEVDLAVGTTSRQHVVHVRPDGKGAKFELVYVQAHGATTM